MDRIKIGVTISNKQYRYDLIRRLTELTAGLEYIVSDNDKCELPAVDFVITEDIAAEYFPVSLLAVKIAEEFGERFVLHFKDKAEHTRTYVVRSRYGGSGCTCAGLVIARILAGRSGGKVAFICRRQDAELYVENTEERSSRELSYMMSHGLETDTDRYGAADRYGVHIFAAGNDAGRLGEGLKKLGFAAIVTDAGCSAELSKLTGEAVINIEGYQDMRAADFESRAAEEIEEGSREFYVLNKSLYRSAGSRFIRAAYDGAGFVRKDKKIEIAMDGLFAASMRELVSMVEKELDDGQSDFYK